MAWWQRFGSVASMEGMHMPTNRNQSISQVKVKAKGCWPHILQRLGIGTKYLTDHHGPCPGCGGKDRFRFDDRDGDGTFICSQGGGEPLAGDGFALLQHVTGWDLETVVRQVSIIIGCMTELASPGLSVRIKSAPEQSGSKYVDETRRKKLQVTWKGGEPLDGRDPASRYLLARGIRRSDWPTALRFHPALAYWVSQPEPKCLGNFPALIARIQDIEGRVVSLQRIYLGEDGKKLVLADPHTGEMLPAKKAMPPIYPGALNGAAVHLDDPDEGGRIMLAEGVETALAAGSLSKWPVWACVSAHGLQRVQLPPAIVQVVIAADRDSSGTGQRAAEMLANRLVAEGREVRILLPEQDGRDWADVAGEMSHECK